MPPKRLSHLFRTQPHHRSEPEAITTTTTTTIAAREPIPLDRARPSVAQLPDAVVRRIVAFARDEDLPALASSSSSLYARARYVQHSHVRVDLDKSRHVLDRLRLIKRLDQLAAIQTLQVSGREYDGGRDENSDIVAEMAAMLPAMTGLRRLDWHVGNGPTVVPISPRILAAMPANLRLHTSVFCNEVIESHVQARAFLGGLAGSQSLCALSVKVTFIEEQHCLETMRALKEVLLSCRNLTRLPNLDVWYPRGGCDGYGPPTVGPYCGLGFSGGEKPPALEELGVGEYPWGLEDVSQCQGYPVEGFKYEWNYWAETFDWSRLVRLNEVPPQLAPAIALKLTHLKELVLEALCWIEADYLQGITSPLELMSLSGWNRVGSKPASIDRFGATLRQLKMHEPEPGWTRDTHSFVTAPDLVHLSKSLPHLEHLALDIAQAKDAQDWPYDTLDAIAAFSRLRDIELWFPLGTKPPAPTPLLTTTSARHLFRYLRERNNNIQRVTLHSGAPLPDFSMLFGTRLDREPSWAMHNSVSFVCSVVYDSEGTEEDGDRLSVSCLELNTEMNARLCRLDRADRKPEDYGKLYADGLRLRVALDGPLNAIEWEAWKGEQLRQARDQQEKSQLTTTLQRLVVGPWKRVWKR
ncbi:hypothetical protein AK830_g184 [Neonectria ditissima]|uniref:Uncharacterized protein n=1 Tax=Neonectria ditissima TaxID=78410 RepID=A0A0P7C3G3_9HYPO|nr:hypothetical protein AK830_g184 [Neonectria ditissima]